MKALLKGLKSATFWIAIFLAAILLFLRFMR